LLFALVMGSGSDAHAFLLKSDPAVGATATAPKTLRLEFSEALELAFSGIEVANGPGGAVPAQNVRLNGNDRKVLLVDLPRCRQVPTASNGMSFPWTRIAPKAISPSV